MMRPSPAELFTEMARLAHSFHWSLDDVLDLEHRDRRRFISEARALAPEGTGDARDPAQSAGAGG